MTEASLFATPQDMAVFLSDEESSSIKSAPTRSVTGKQKSADGKKKVVSNSKSKSSSSSRSAAKMEDLSNLENKLSEQIESKFSSLDGKFEQLIGLLNFTNGADTGRPSNVQNGQVDNSTTGACRPQEAQRNVTSGGHEPLIPLQNSLNQDYGLNNPDTDDILSLQPGQRERQGIGLLSSEEGEKSSVGEQEQVINTRFGKYTNLAQASSGKENEPLTHDMLAEMFGEDAETDASSSKVGLCLDKTQIDILNTSWRCQAPDKLSAYKESSKQCFPVSEDADKVLKVPSLDDLTERLLIKKHGRRAAFGSSQSLFTQPYKSVEKIAYQGQVAARMGIISVCYTQQALGRLLNNLSGKSPNLDEAVQNVRDIFAMSTKSLDQMSRTGAFHHLIRRKATIADSGLHEFKDLQKTALTSPLSGEGIFGVEFEKKLKDRQEKDKQLSELMPEMSKRFFSKTKGSFPSESSSQKKPRQSENAYSRAYKSSGYNSNYGYSNSNYRKPSRGGSFASNYRGKDSRNTSVSSFRLQGDKSSKA